MAIPFKEKIKTLSQLIAEPSVLRLLLSLRNTGYLIDIGWFDAFKSGKSVNKELKPVPWVTYPFIDFIEGRLNKTMKVFEYGSGFSTLFYTERTLNVTSVEHNAAWFEKIKSIVPKNSDIIFCEDDIDGLYSKAVKNKGEQYDLIIIDANDRVNCAKQALSALTDRGVVILDDSDREEYKEAFDLMKQSGFREITFSGISPGYFNRKATTVFYRQGNCLNI
ncbi:MAG: FkbM family methyltransferase [Ignavibacteria bacterium]|nr:FkbM family methyltransferase [Ignavibacteria bacterium]